MNILYGLPPGGGLKQGSPWVMKVQLGMRCLQFEYSLQEVSPFQLKIKGLNRKVPWLEMDKSVISGSEKILAAIENYPLGAKYPVPEDCDIPKGTSYVRLVEDHLWWIICASKYLGPEAKKMWGAMLPSLPRFICSLFAIIGEKWMRGRIQITSLAGLTHQEIVQEARKDIAALSDRLSHSTFIAGNGLSVFDFSVAAHLASILYWSFDNWLADLFREEEIFYQYLDRVADAVGGFEFRA